MRELVLVRAKCGGFFPIRFAQGQNDSFAPGVE
jgi:hypothetical protein